MVIIQYRATRKKFPVLVCQEEWGKSMQLFMMWNLVKPCSLWASITTGEFRATFCVFNISCSIPLILSYCILLLHLAMMNPERLWTRVFPNGWMKLFPTWPTLWLQLSSTEVGTAHKKYNVQTKKNRCNKICQLITLKISKICNQDQNSSLIPLGKFGN